MSSSIIILTYNSSLFIQDLLTSLEKISDKSEILVVDNSSSDDTLKLVKEFKFVKAIKAEKNLGFAHGINFGVSQVTGDYLLFLNPDAKFKSGSIDDLISVFESNQKAGIVGGKIIKKDGSAENSAGTFFGLWQTLLISLGLDEALGVRFSPKKISRVDFISGGFLMVKKSVFEELDGFDEHYFMYVEDMDFCYRANKLGYQTFFTPNAVIEHVGQGSSNRGFAIINIYKGLIYFHKKYKSTFDNFAVRSLLRLKAMTVYFLGRITNNKYYIQTYGEVLKLF